MYLAEYIECNVETPPPPKPPKETCPNVVELKYDDKMNEYRYNIYIPYEI